MSAGFGVLLMAYGSPATLDDVEAYFTHIRGGRTPPPDRVRALRVRYERIGGRSPLLEITQRQAAGLERALERAGQAARVYVGMKHAPPFVADAVAQAAREGIRSVVGIAMAPHFSQLSVGAYCAAAAKAAGCWDLALQCVQSWHDHPGLIGALATRIRQARQACTDPASVPVIFTAHSLPQRILAQNDPYPAELWRTSELVAAAAALPRWQLAYQSASETGEPWLGPDLLDALRQWHRQGVREVVVCPVGFVADHLEILYDIDVEGRDLADRLGMHLVRTASLNDAPDFIAVLADLVTARVPTPAAG